LVVAACTKTPPATTSEAATAGPAAASGDLVARGRVVYSTNCTACHNADPKRPGALGPDVHGSSEALLVARILKAEYPAGYTPKRATRSMVPLPHLEADIPALAAYLNAP
jgi:mono/diheme cytochrome c family protein